MRILAVGLSNFGDLAASVLALHAREVKRPPFMQTLGLAILVVIVAAAVLALVFYVR